MGNEGARENTHPKMHLRCACVIVQGAYCLTTAVLAFTQLAIHSMLKAIAPITHSMPNAPYVCSHTSAFSTRVHTPTPWYGPISQVPPHIWDAPATALYVIQALHFCLLNGCAWVMPLYPYSSTAYRTVCNSSNMCLPELLLVQFHGWSHSRNNSFLEITMHAITLSGNLALTSA